MENPKNPPDEAKRLETLRALKILDTAAEERYDRITRVAQSIFEVPIVLVSIVDAERQWFKSRQGLDAAETPRDISFCGHAILGTESFIVEDTAKDPRFADNPLVLGGPKLRFYAGAPLSAPNGQRMGTLCLIDTKPRQLTPLQRQVLRDLAAMVEREMANVTLAEALTKAAENESKYKDLLDETTDLVLHSDDKGTLIYANSALLAALGLTETDFGKVNIYDLVAPRSRERYVEGMAQAIAGSACVLIDAVFQARCGALVLVRGRSCAHAQEGRTHYVSSVLRDVTIQTRTQKRLAAQFAATKALAQATTWREGLEGVLEGIGAAMDWTCAGAWELDDAGGELYCSHFWSTGGKSSPFSRQSREMRFKSGTGLPGRTWVAAKPAWIADVIADPNFPRIKAAREEGIRMGLAVPVMIGDKVEGVIEFFDNSPAEPDPELVGLLSSVGSQLGEFLRRRRSEKALQRSMKATVDLQTALDSSAIVVVTDAAGRIVSCNDLFTKISGYSREELIGKTHKIVNSGHHPHGFFKEMWDVISSGKTWRGEICNRNKSGGIYWVDTTITPFMGEDGKPVQYVAIRNDITDRKLLSADFEGQVSAIGKSLAVIEFNLDGTIIDANLNFLATTGFTLDEVKGRHHRMFCDEAYAAGPEYRDFWAKLKSGVHLSGEYKRYGKNRKEVWIKGSYNPIIGLDGRPTKVVKYAVDITARKQAEAAAAEAGSRLQAVLDNATQVSIIATDLQGNITVFNKGAENLLGYSAAEMRGQSPALIHIREEVEARGKLLSMEYGRPIEGFDVFVESARQGGFDSREWTYVRKDGTHFPVKLTITALHNANGAMSGFLGIAVDVSESRRASEELGKARDAALDLAKAKAEFLANMSHEIRTPMNAVIGMTGLLMDTELSPQQREFGETIRNAGESLLAIIGDILDFSKMEAGSMPLEVLDFDPRIVAEEVAMLFAARAQDKGLEIAAAVEEGLPPRLRGDAGRLRQILSNFVSNAIKFTEKGEVSLRLRKLSEDAASVRVRFEVQDSGIGIDEAGKAKLFKAFSQADASTTRKYGGTGLGLAIAKKLVELMQGSVGIDSVPGKGSTFWIEVVMQKGEAVPLAEIPEVEGVRVLIVDDNATNREIVTHQTSSWRMRPVAVDGGKAAVGALRAAIAEKDPFVLALVDMQMPAMDGTELAAVIKKDPALSGLKLILLSSMSTTLGRDELIKQGFSGALTKPVRKSSLFDAISDVLSIRPSAGGATAAGRGRPALVKAAPVAKRSSWANLRILIAEDNVINQKVALLQLQKLGCKADTVANGREAVEAVSTMPYDLVLMDCQMPEMDGFEATKIIRARQKSGGRRTVIVAMTANALEGDREKCLAAGMDDYVSKPVRIDNLAATIGRWTPTVDPAALSGLRELSDETEITALVEDFIKDAEGRIATLQSAARAGDASAIEKQAHSLKGASGNLGAVEVQQLALKLETMGREKRLEGADALIAALEAELTDAARQLRAKPVLKL